VLNRGKRASRSTARPNGLDVFIGESCRADRGLGTHVLSLLSDYLIKKLGASAMSLTTGVDNRGARPGYKTKADFSEVKQVPYTETYRGALSWLMEMRRP
jgi:ribosomal protein S18 acetylase RimI-like enzyme